MPGEIAKEDLLFIISGMTPRGSQYDLGCVRVASRGGTGAGEDIKEFLQGCLRKGLTVRLTVETPSRFSPVKPA